MPGGAREVRRGPTASADGREDVAERRGRRDGRAGAPAARELDEKRHLQRLAVQEHPVLGLAVVAEPFAVVGEEDDERLVVEAALLQEARGSGPTIASAAAISPS